jgi:hypothetical protein
MKARRTARGAVVLELALTLGFLFPVAAFLLFYGRLLYNYELAQKASHDAARYIASASVRNMNSSAMVGYELAVAQAIVVEELGRFDPTTMALSILCDGMQCAGLSVPSTVTVSLQIKVSNPMFDLAPELVDQAISATHTMRYVGN